MKILNERIHRVLKRHATFKTKEDVAKYLGCSRSMLFHYEKGNPPPPPEILSKLTQLEIVLGISGSTDVEFVGPYAPIMDSTNGEDCATRRIPVIGWAHAGQAASYEELPISWQRQIPTDCRDPKAFGVILEGDSMEPLFKEGDLLVLMPGERVYNGCLAVVRLASDGVMLRRIEVREQRFRLVPINPRYETDDLSCDQVAWAYPVWGCWRQAWK